LARKTRSSVKVLLLMFPLEPSVMPPVVGIAATRAS
jgi:hypothetical protein